MTGPEQPTPTHTAFHPGPGSHGPTRMIAPAVRKLDNLTGVRAYAALWVVLVHISRLGFAGRFGTLINHGVIAVDLFFVLSGLVLSMVYVPALPGAFSWGWYRRFLARRLAKIYPVHLLTFCLAAFIVVTARHFFGTHPMGDTGNTCWSALCNVLLLHAFGARMALSWNGVSWSVAAEWFAYTVLFAPMVFLLRGLRLRWVILAAAALWVGLFAFFVLLHVYDPDKVAGARLLRITPEFFGGYALYRWIASRPGAFSKRGSSRKQAAGGDFYTLCGVAGMVLLALGPMAGAILLLPVMVLLLRGVHAGGCWTDRIFGNRAAILLGEASFSLYMTHLFVIVAGNHLQQVHPAHSRAEVAALALAEFSFALALGFACFRWVEEPLRQRLLRLFSAQDRSPEALTPPLLPGLASDTEAAAAIS